MYNLFANCRGPGVPATYITQIEAMENAAEMTKQLQTLEWHDYILNEKLEETVKGKGDGWITRKLATYTSPNYPETVLTNTPPFI